MATSVPASRRRRSVRRTPAWASQLESVMLLGDSGLASITSCGRSTPGSRGGQTGPSNWPKGASLRSRDSASHASGAHRAEAVLHGMLVQRVAICRPQAPADLARGQQMIPADQRLRNLIEDARPALDEDLVPDDRGDALLDVL